LSFFAGIFEVGDGCWPSLIPIDNGVLRIDTLVIGGSIIQGGLAASSPLMPSGRVVVGQLVVSNGTEVELEFLSPGIFLTYDRIEVTRFRRVFFVGF
jgi:hypothetical protein